MKRKMIGAAAAYMAGLFFALFFHNVKIIIIFAAAVAVFVTIFVKKGFRLCDFAVIAVCFGISFSVGTLYTKFYCSKITAYDGRTGSFEGEITDIRYYSGEKALYTLKGTINGVQTAKVNYYGDVLDADYGDIVKLDECRFSAPENSYLFSSESYYKSDGIFLNAGYCNDISVEKMNRKILKKVLMNYRERMISEFRIILGEDCGDFLAGMVFGEKYGMNDNMKTSLYRCGIGHILAVSGLHISIIAMAVMSIMKKLRINRYVSFGMVNAVMIIFITMANYPVSAVRAAVMMNFVYSARLFRRQNDTFNSLAAAILIICVFNPYAVYSSGFLLSITATFGIGVFGPYMTRNFAVDSNFGRIFRSFAILLCTSVCILPLNMKLFEETSLIAPVSNLIIVPLCSAALIIGFIFVITGGLLPILGPAGYIIRFVLYVSDKIARTDIAYFSCVSDKTAAAAFGLAFAVIILQLVFGSRKVTAIAAAASCGIIVVCSSANGRSRFNSFNIAVLGKSSNAAVVISHHGETVVVDISGNYRSCGYVRKYLAENGIKEIDSVIMIADIPSQYAAYSDELEMFRVGSWLAIGENVIPGVGAAEFMQNGFELTSSDYIISYDNETLSVRYDEMEVVFTDAGSGAILSDSLNICYGKIPSGTEKIYNWNVIYVGENSKDEMNNFEIELLENSSYIIRRL